MIKNVDTTPGVNKKHIPKFKGPYEIKKVLPNDRYVIQDIPGSRVTQMPFNSVYEARNMKSWIKILIAINHHNYQVLIGDNLASHINECVLSLCDTHNIKFICLPPNTSHIAQPLDIAFFRLIKGAWRDLSRQWKKTKTGSNYSTFPKET